MLARWPAWRAVKGNNKFSASVALAELGGEECVRALEEACAREEDDDWRAHFEDCLARARRQRGPKWDPAAPEPWWKGKPARAAPDPFQPVR